MRKEPITGYIVPREIPKYCNKCRFGDQTFQHPWNDPRNGDRNLKWGFSCSLLHNRETAIGEYGTDLPKPEDCPLIEVPEVKQNRGNHETN